jgi:riboflavin kinase / FMN adenylyltransferase
MRVFHDISGIYAIKRPVAAIGIFDGVHRAHMAIIDKLKSTAAQLHGESVILTMWPHPRLVLKRGGDIKLLTSLEEKIKRIEETGIDNLIILTFNKTFADTGFEEFVEETLVKRLGILHLVVGYNHQFGRNREGNYARLQSLASQFGFGLSQQDPVLVGDDRVSSSNIRRLILNGLVDKANENLGYPFFLKGIVVKGKGIGQQLGFPTANIAVSDTDKIIPCDGVYAVYVEMEGIFYQGMMNIGCRPTIDDDCKKSILEVNLFGFSGDIYGNELNVFFIRRIRGELKFSGLKALSEQISKDKQLIKNILDLVKIKNDKLVI